MPAHVAGRLARPDRRAPGDHCPIDRAMQVVGTRSAMLLLREAWYGTTRFDDFATRVGISDAITSARLRELVEAGLMERRPYREPGQRTRHEYVLTESGTDLVPVLIGLAAWGRKHSPRDWSPAATHAGCGAAVDVEIRCADGHTVGPDDVLVTG
jgi:DNA-binding HxlR family transcriptional regulator